MKTLDFRVRHGAPWRSEKDMTQDWLNGRTVKINLREEKVYTYKLLTLKQN